MKKKDIQQSMVKTLYHGSSICVGLPVFGQGCPENDYGRGFYCTEDLELAREWACFEPKDGFANKYEIDLSGLTVLNLNSGTYSILHWLSILVENRRISHTSAVMQASASWLAEHFHVDLRMVDVIVGYWADDSYFQFARAFLANAISLQMLGKAMKLGGSGEQVVIKSERAFAALQPRGWIEAPYSVYYAKRKSRDEKARRQFEEMSAKGLLAPGEIFIRDIITQGMEATDARLF